MAHDQFKAFLEAVSADSSLQVKLNSAADAEIIVAIAKDAGFAISAEAVENHLKEKLDESDVELTAEQLEAVAGGAMFATRIITTAMGEGGGDFQVGGGDFQVGGGRGWW